MSVQTRRPRPHYDVVVRGGGTAGAIAGIAAARTGAKTLLIEQYGNLGGVLTLGMSLKGVHDVEGRKALGGIGAELIESARAEDGATAVASHPRHGSIMGQDGEAMKLKLIAMTRAAGLDLLLHTFLVDAALEGTAIRHVRVAHKGGLESISASCFVDCTGDADLAARAGATFIHGREGVRIAACLNAIKVPALRPAELIGQFLFTRRTIAQIDKPPPINPSQRQLRPCHDQLELCYG